MEIRKKQDKPRIRRVASDDCTGCLGQREARLCDQLPACVELGGPDGSRRDYIWIKVEAPSTC